MVKRRSIEGGGRVLVWVADALGADSAPTVIRVVVVRRRLSAREKERKGERERGKHREQKRTSRGRGVRRFFVAERSGGARRAKVCSGGKRTCTWASARGGRVRQSVILYGPLKHIFWKGKEGKR